MKWIKKNMTTILLLLILLVGLSLLLYPTVSDYWNSLHQSRAIATYAQAVAEVDDKQYEHMWMMLTNITNSSKVSQTAGS